MAKSIFYQMASFIDLFIILAQLFSLLPGRDDRRHSPFQSLIKYFIGIITPIRQKILGTKTVNQRDCLLAIRCCALCNNSPERHTMRIHGQMQF